MALPGLIGLIVFSLVGVTLVVLYGPGGNVTLDLLGGIAGCTVAGVIVVALAAFRVHRWTIEESGVRIEERPKVPLCGLKRRAFVPFSEIAALSRVASGFDLLIEITTRRATRYRLPRKYMPQLSGIGIPQTEALEAFAAAIHAAAAKSGHTLPPTAEALSMWNRPFGIGLQVLMFLFALAIAIAAAATLFGGGAGPRPRVGESYAIAILLPVGAGYMLYRSIKRRRAVLRGRAVAGGG